MKVGREQLERFVDGELSRREAEEVRRALAAAPDLRAELDEILDFEAMVSSMVEDAGAVIPLPRSAKPKQRRTSGAWLLAAAALLGSLGLAGIGIERLIGPAERLSGPAGRGALDEFLTSLGPRHVAVRLTAADTFTRHDPLLAEGPSERPPPPPHLLARLDSERDRLAVGAAYVLTGSPELAAGYFSQAEGPDGWSDLAAAYHLLGRDDDALALLDRALAREPRHPQALWNRGLVLQSLGRSDAAAEAFDAAAAVASEAWAKAARARAARLRGR